MNNITFKAVTVGNQTTVFGSYIKPDINGGPYILDNSGVKYLIQKDTLSWNVGIQSVEGENLYIGDTVSLVAKDQMTGEYIDGVNQIEGVINYRTENCDVVIRHPGKSKVICILTQKNINKRFIRLNK